MVALGQHFSVMRGDRYRQPFQVDLDQGRVLDGSEAWRFHVRRRFTDAGTSLQLASPSGITVDVPTQVVTVVFEPATLDLVNFPPRNKPANYVFDLEMTKDGAPETVAQGEMTVYTDVAR